MNMNAMMLAAIAAGFQPQTYVVHASLPRGEAVAATVRVNDPGDATIALDGGVAVPVKLGPGTTRPDRSLGPVLEILSTSEAIVQAAIRGKSRTQVAFGPQRTCVDLSISTYGNTVVATGTAALPPPPPPVQGDRPMHGGRGPRGGGNANVTIRIVATLDRRQLASAHGDVGPAANARGPHFTWSLTRTGE